MEQGLVCSAPEAGAGGLCLVTLGASLASVSPGKPSLSAFPRSRECLTDLESAC